MTAIKQMKERFSLNHSLKYAGLAKTAWYHKPKSRDLGINRDVLQAVQKTGHKRPTYGTRRMAAQLSRELARPVNRKQMQRIYRKMGWIVPRKRKHDIIKSAKRRFKPTRSNHLWEMDMTYVWCGRDGWCYCFNVVDAFTRKWVSFVFSPTAKKAAAIDSLIEAVASANPDISGLRIRTDNGSQYASREFQDAAKALGIQHEFIWRNTPEQNGHVESFHKTLKKEYIWPHEFESYQHARDVLKDAYTDYNNVRIHSAIGYITPQEFLKEQEMTNK